MYEESYSMSCQNLDIVVKKKNKEILKKRKELISAYTIKTRERTTSKVEKKEKKAPTLQVQAQCCQTDPVEATPAPSSRQEELEEQLQEMKNERDLNEWHLKQEIDILKQKLQEQVIENQQLRAQGGEADDKTKLTLRSYIASIDSESDTESDLSEDDLKRVETLESGEERKK